MNRFNVAPEDAGRLLEAWAEDAVYMKQQPGFISTQLNRGSAGF
jgi:heme-degrading monooxygenase HmoA